MNIKTRLFVGYASYFILIALIGLIFSIQLKKLAEPLNTAIPRAVDQLESDNYKATLINDILHQYHQKIHFLENYILLDNAAYLAEYNMSTSLLDSLLIELKNNDFAAWTKLTNCFKLSTKYEETALNLSRNHKIAQAKKYLQSDDYSAQIKYLQKEITSYYQQYNSFSRDTASFTARIAARNSSQILKNSGHLILLLTALAAILSIMAAIIMNRTILYPIQLLRKDMDNVNFDEFNTQWQPSLTSGTDEIGKLAKSFNQLIFNLQARTHNLKLLFDVTDIGTKEIDFLHALPLCLKSICLRLGYPIGHIYLIDESDNKLLIPSNFWYFRDKLKFINFYKQTMGLKIREGEDIAGEVLKTAAPLLIPNIEENLKLSRSNVCKELGLKSAIAFPIMVKNNIIAVFEFFMYELTEQDKIFYESIHILSEQMSRVFERQNTAKLTHQVEERRRALLIIDNAKECYFSYDSTGKIIEWNKESERTFGWKRHEIIGKSIFETIMPVQYHDKHKSNLASFLKTEEGFNPNKRLEVTALRKNGKEFPAELSITAIKVDEAYTFSIFLLDITERKTNEEAQSMLSAIVKFSDDAIIGKDLNGKIYTWNHGAERLYGYKSSEIIGKSILTIFPDFKKEEFQKLMSNIRNGNSVQNYETIRIKKNGTMVPVSLTISPIRNVENTIIGAATTSRDISIQKLLEEQLKTKNIELEKKIHELDDAVLARDRFFASMSHELRTPLNSILGFTSTLLMKLPGELNPEQEHQLQIVKKSSTHLLALINDLLHVSKIESGNVISHIENFSCLEVIETVVATLLPLAQAKSLLLKIEPPKKDIIVTSDQRTLMQIVLNIVNNAIKYTEAGEIVIKLSKKSKYAVISVIDTGIGIKSEDQSRLFQAFSQIERPNQPLEGTGLGLHVSKKLAEVIKANIQMKSEYGVGSEFIIYVPLIM